MAIAAVAVAVARAVGAKGVRTGSKAGLYVGLAIGGLAILGLLYSISQSDPPAQARTTAVPEESEPEETGYDELAWNGPIAMAARKAHEAARQRDAARLEKLLEFGWIHARENATADGDPGDPEAFYALPFADQRTLIDRVTAELVADETHAEVGAWEPYDGSVIEQDGDTAVVHLSTTPEGGGVEKRTIEWKVARRMGGSWKAWAWGRYLTPEEAARLARQARNREVKKVELSDGSVVLEREPQPLAHLDSTPAELRAEIDKLYETMVDLDLTREATRARTRIEEIGRPAIPRLLTGLYETPLDSEENAIRANITVVALRSITAQDFGYEPQVLVGSSQGTTEERRQSAIKQWFAWWYLNERRFEEKEVSDGLEGVIELTEKEKAWLERNKD